jgi:hypothetical protein
MRGKAPASFVDEIPKQCRVRIWCFAQRAVDCAGSLKLGKMQHRRHLARDETAFTAGKMVKAPFENEIAHSKEL